MTEKGNVDSLFATGKEEEFTLKGFKFKIKKLTWGDKEDIRNASVKQNPRGGVDVDMKEMNTQTILKSLVEAPFKIEREKIMQLERNVGDALLLQINDFTGLSGDVAKNLKDLLEEKEK